MRSTIEDTARAAPPLSPPDPGSLPPGPRDRTAAAEGRRTAPHRLAYLVTHPIQYQAPLLRHLAREPRLEIEALFLSDVSVGEFHHAAFRERHAWDVPLLEGYEHRFLDAWGRTDRLGFLRPLTRDLAATLRAGGYDALWVHGWGHQASLRALAVARRLGLPVLLRGEASDLVRRPPHRRALGALVRRWVLRHASAALSIGSANRSFYERAGFPGERVFHVPYAVDNERFREGARRARAGRDVLRAGLGIPAGAPVVLHASRLVRHKRAADLLRAFRSLGSRRGDAHLVVVGDGPERRRLEALAGRDLGSAVHFVGFSNQTELPRWYALADLFCLPSLHEPWGLVVNEAMCAGLPVLASDRVGSAVDLVRPGENGWIVPAGRPDALAPVLEAALGDPARLAAMGRRSAEIVQAFSFDEDRRGLLAALDAVVDR